MTGPQRRFTESEAERIVRKAMQNPRGDRAEGRSADELREAVAELGVSGAAFDAAVDAIEADDMVVALSRQWRRHQRESLFRQAIWSAMLTTVWVGAVILVDLTAVVAFVPVAVFAFWVWRSLAQIATGPSAEVKESWRSSAMLAIEERKAIEREERKRERRRQKKQRFYSATGDFFEAMGESLTNSIEKLTAAVRGEDKSERITARTRERTKERTGVRVTLDAEKAREVEEEFEALQKRVSEKKRGR